MFKVINKQTRPNINVQFWTLQTAEDVPMEVRGYFKTNYVDTGKIVSVDSILSPDSLSMTTTTIWLDEDAFNSWYNDSIIVNAQLKSLRDYVAAQGIVYEVVSRENV